MLSLHVALPICLEDEVGAGVVALRRCRAGGGGEGGAPRQVPLPAPAHHRGDAAVAQGGGCEQAPLRADVVTARVSSPRVPARLAVPRPRARSLSVAGHPCASCSLSLALIAMPPARVRTHRKGT